MGRRRDFQQFDQPVKVGYNRRNQSINHLGQNRFDLFIQNNPVDQERLPSTQQLISQFPRSALYS
jgi:hypothetical protein